MQCLWLREKNRDLKLQKVSLIMTKSSWLFEPLQQIIGLPGHYNITNVKPTPFAYKHLDLDRGCV